MDNCHKHCPAADRPAQLKINVCISNKRNLFIWPNLCGHISNSYIARTCGILGSLNLCLTASIFLLRALSCDAHFLEPPCASIFFKTRSLRCKFLPKRLPAAYFLVDCFLDVAQRLVWRVFGALEHSQGSLRLGMFVRLGALGHRTPKWGIQIIYFVLLAFSFQMWEKYNRIRWAATALYT